MSTFASRLTALSARRHRGRPEGTACWNSLNGSARHATQRGKALVRSDRWLATVLISINFAASWTRTLRCVDKFTVPWSRRHTVPATRLSELRRIPYGETRSYVVSPGPSAPFSAARGWTRERSNRIAIVVRAHRVVNKSGARGGTAGNYGVTSASPAGASVFASVTRGLKPRATGCRGAVRSRILLAPWCACSCRSCC